MSRVLRGLKHIGQGSEKYRFSLHVESVHINTKAEKTFATVEWLRGPKRCRGREVVVLSRGANTVRFSSQELVLIATLFRSKGDGERGGEKEAPSKLKKFSLRRHSSVASEAGAPPQAANAETSGRDDTEASAACVYLPKESKLQLVEVQESGRRSFRSFASSRSQLGASALASPPDAHPPEASGTSLFRRGASKPASAESAKLVVGSNVLGECRLDLAQFVNGREGDAADAPQRVTLPLDRCEDAQASITFLVSWTLLGSAVDGEDDDAVSLHSGLVSLASEETFFKQPVSSSVASLLRVSPAPVHPPLGKETGVSLPAHQTETGASEGRRTLSLSVSDADAATRGLSPQEQLRNIFAKRGPESQREEGDRGRAQQRKEQKGEEDGEKKDAEAKVEKNKETEGKSDGTPSRPLGAASVTEMLKARERSIAAQNMGEDRAREFLPTRSPVPSPASEVSTRGSSLPVAASPAQEQRTEAEKPNVGGQSKTLSSLLSRRLRKDGVAAAACKEQATAEESKVLQLLQRVSDLERRNEEHQRLLVKAQQALEAKESAERDEYEKKIRNLFSQIEELHSALANAQEQQLTTVQQLEEERAKAKGGRGDKETTGKNAVSPTAYGTLQEELNQLKAQMKQAEQTHAEVELQYRMRQKQQQEKIDALQASLQNQQEEAHAERAALQALLREQQTTEESKDETVRVLTKENRLLEEQRELLRQQCEQTEQKLCQSQDHLREETAAREKAERELAHLRSALGDTDEDPLRHQLLTLQQEVSELTATRDELRRQKERDEQAHLQQLHQLQEQLRVTRDQQQERIHIVEQEKVTLRMQVLALEHEISYCPKSPGERDFAANEQFAKKKMGTSLSSSLAPSANLGGNADEAAAARERREAEKRTAQLIEELEMDLVKTKIELALAEQQRAEDLDLCKNKVASLKDTILSYAAVVSDLEVQVADLKLQAQSRDFFSSTSTARRLRPIRSLKSFFRAASSSRCSSSQQSPQQLPHQGALHASQDQDARVSPSSLSGALSPLNSRLRSAPPLAEGEGTGRGEETRERRASPLPSTYRKQSSHVVVFDADDLSFSSTSLLQKRDRDSRGEGADKRGTGCPPLPVHATKPPPRSESFRFRLRSSTQACRRERSEEGERISRSSPLQKLKRTELDRLPAAAKIPATVTKHAAPNVEGLVNLLRSKHSRNAVLPYTQTRKRTTKTSTIQRAGTTCRNTWIYIYIYIYLYINIYKYI
uniref:Pseudouridylate synthase 1, putative n=2 Tax=Toxoplasma gondii TaxID=5811 RepID=A0A0F7V974_TOXGV|nr:TPA: pseudouridylate synthase 1, putative [Toxoplasma gondii VEG]